MTFLEASETILIANGKVHVTHRDSVTDYVLHILYSVGPLTLEAGDIVKVFLQTELTYDPSGHAGWPANPAAGRFVVRTTSPSSYIGKRVVKATVENMGVQVAHHRVFSHAGAERIVKRATGQYYNAVVYVADDGFPPADCTVKFEDDYGSLIVEQTTPVGVTYLGPRG